MGTKDDSECQEWRKNANGYGCGYETTAPNIELRMNNDSERQSANVALNAEIENITLNAKTENDDGSERQTEKK